MILCDYTNSPLCTLQMLVDDPYTHTIPACTLQPPVTGSLLSQFTSLPLMVPSTQTTLGHSSPSCFSVGVRLNDRDFLSHGKMKLVTLPLPLVCLALASQFALKMLFVGHILRSELLTPFCVLTLGALIFPCSLPSILDVPARSTGSRCLRLFYGSTRSGHPLDNPVFPWGFCVSYYIFD